MLINLTYIFIYILFATMAQVLLKISMLEMGVVKINIDFFLNSIMNIKILFSLFLHGLCFAIWLIILNKVEISFAYPLLSFSVVVVAIISWIFFNEAFTMLRLCGIVLTIIGSWLIIKS